MAIDDLNHWTYSACEHDMMSLVSERIGNIMGVAWLRAMVAELNHNAYGTLLPILRGLSGLMDETLPSEDASRALPEIEALLRRSTIGATRIILDADGQLIRDEIDHVEIDYGRYRPLHIGPRSGTSGVVDLGVHDHDFVVRGAGDPPLELFRARLVEQKWRADSSVLSFGHVPPVGEVTFRNIETGATVSVRSYGVPCRVPWPDGALWHQDDGYQYAYPSLFFISERTRMVTELWWQLSALHRLFAASALTGNPVVWG